MSGVPFDPNGTDRNGTANTPLTNRAYVASRGYNLLTVLDYGKTMEKVGFRNVSAMDRTKQFITVLQSELEKFKGMKEQFIKVHSYHATI